MRAEPSCKKARWPAARPGAEGLDGVDGGEHHLRIVHVRGAHQDCERDALGVDHKMALRALFAAIRWVLARLVAPGAGTAAESSVAPYIQMLCYVNKLSQLQSPQSHSTSVY